MSKKPTSYMLVMKWNVDKTQEGEYWKHQDHIDQCTNLQEFLKYVNKGQWKRVRHVFYFKDIRDALMVKFHYYDDIKYVSLLDENNNVIKS